MLRQGRTGAGLATIAVVVGPPAAAVWWWQHTGRRLPSRAGFDAWVADPLTEVTLVILLAFGVFALWLLLVVTVLATIRHQLRRAWAQVRRMPIPTPAQATATSMAGAAAFSMPALSAIGVTVEVVSGSPDQPTPLAPHHLPPDFEGESASAATEGVALSDGSWLPAETAQAVTVAAALGWLRRRRDYTPTPTAGDRRDEPDLPLIVAAVQQQVAEHLDTSGHPTRAAGRRDDSPLLADRLPGGGVGLLGPGAMDAARGVLVTALLSATTVQVVTTIADLERLLGTAAEALTVLPGLHVAGDLDSAVAYLDRCSAVAGERRPVLLAEIPRADDGARRVRTAVRQHGHAAVLLGDGAHGVTRWINTDGTVADPGGERWCVLTRRTAADLCVLAAHAYGLPGTPSHPSADELAPSDAPVSPTTTDTSCPAPGLALTVLGLPTLAYRGSPVHLRRAAALQTLVLLAVDRDGVNARRLGAALWPGEQPKATSSRVYTTVSELRQTLSAHGGTPVVHRDGDQYRLDPHHIDVDLWRLHHALTLHNGTPEDSHHDSDPTATAKTLADLYTGDLAAGRDWSWLEPHRERLRRRTLNALTALAASAAPQDRQTILQHALRVDDCNELIVRRLLTIYADIGDHGRVSELTAAFRAKLADRGLAPSKEFHRFVEELRTRK